MLTAFIFNLTQLDSRSVKNVPHYIFALRRIGLRQTELKLRLGMLPIHTHRACTLFERAPDGQRSPLPCQRLSPTSRTGHTPRTHLPEIKKT